MRLTRYATDYWQNVYRGGSSGYRYLTRADAERAASSSAIARVHVTLKPGPNVKAMQVFKFDDYDVEAPKHAVWCKWNATRRMLQRTCTCGHLPDPEFKLRRVPRFEERE